MQNYDRRGNYLQSTDWMAVSITLDDELPHVAPEGYIWQIQERGTNVWGYHALLYNKYGEKVLTLLAKPKANSVLNPRAGIVEVANEWLYHGIGVQGIMSLLKQCCSYRITGLSRLDLCMDFQPTPEQAEIIKGLDVRRYYVQGKQNGTGFYSTPNSGWVPPMWKGYCPHQQSWGHKTSQVKWKLYYKSKELRDNGGGWFSKPYIVDGWRYWGLDENNVWRLEVSMKDCNSLLKDGVEISYNNWCENELEIFTAMYKSRFVVREKQGHKDKTNDRMVRFLDIDTFGQVKCKKYEGDSVHSSRIALLRRLVEFGEKEEVYLDSTSSKALCAHVESIVMNDGLSRYFESMVGMTLGQWTNVMIERRGGKCLLQNALPKNVDIHPNDKFDTLAAR